MANAPPSRSKLINMREEKCSMCAVAALVLLCQHGYVSQGLAAMAVDRVERMRPFSLVFAVSAWLCQSESLYQRGYVSPGRYVSGGCYISGVAMSAWVSSLASRYLTRKVDCMVVEGLVDLMDSNELMVIVRFVVM